MSGNGVRFNRFYPDCGMWRVDNLQPLVCDALWSRWHFRSNGQDD
jgi:hypothetical protein